MTRQTIPAPIHAVVIGSAQDHRASLTCWCRPAETHRDLGTSTPVYVHHDTAVVRGRLPMPLPVVRHGR